MTVSGVICGPCANPNAKGPASTRNRCPSLVTAYMLLTLTDPVGKSAFGDPNVSVASIGTTVIVPLASR